MMTALDRYAQQHPTSSWRMERSCLARFVENVNGGKYRSWATEIRRRKNPVAPAERPKRPPRARKVSEGDILQMLVEMDRRGDRAGLAAITLGEFLGLRPAEMPRVQVEVVEWGAIVRVPRAKRRGDRSIQECVLELTLTPEDAEALAEAAKTLWGQPMRPIQDRIHRAAKDLWPRRKVVPSLLTLRHQLGSDLKASSLDRREAAAIFGHRSQESLQSYGRRRSGGRGVKIRASEETIAQVSPRPPRDPSPEALEQERESGPGMGQ
jgi:site-specific recombinase XerC